MGRWGNGGLTLAGALTLDRGKDTRRFGLEMRSRECGADPAMSAGARQRAGRSTDLPAARVARQKAAHPPQRLRLPKVPLFVLMAAPTPSARNGEESAEGCCTMAANTVEGVA